MPNPVQFDISVGALPDNLDTDPQGLLQAFAERLFISPSVPWSSFTLGAAQPTSDLGPWFKNGQELWVWSDSLATYIPLQLNSASLKYFVGTSAPDPTLYLFWIDTNSPQAVKIYVAGNWIDVYAARFAQYSTTTAMNAAIAAAVAAIPTANSYVGTATQNAPQSIPVDAAYHKMTLDTAQINDAGAINIAASRYVAPVAGDYHVSITSQWDNDTGVASSMQILASLYKNGTLATEGIGSGAADAGSAGRWWISWSGIIRLAQNDFIEVWAELGDGTNTGNVDLTTWDFAVHKV